MFDTFMTMAILPEVLLLVVALLVLVMELVWKGEDGRKLGWLAFGGLMLVLVASLVMDKPTNGGYSVFGGMLRYDMLGLIFKMLFIFGAGLTALFMMDSEKLGQRGESYILLIVATIGMSLMATANDLIMLYLAIETTSIPMYILAGFMRDDEKSTEAGFKYLLFGAMTSAIMLYGFSLIFGFTGSTALTAITGFSMPLAIGVILLITVGVGFKISLAPFHFWAPDVYEGAPTPISGFLSTASKAAGFAVVMRLFIGLFPHGEFSQMWTLTLAILASLSMTLGNLVALRQTNLKRLLAYSSIGHAGYALVGAVSLSELGVGSVTFYLIAYLMTNLAAFGIVAAFSRVAHSDEIADYAGMSRRNPGLALAMLVAFLSLAGMPPFGGFVAKVFVFAAAVKADMIWLAIVGVLNSIIGVYYYLTVLKVVYLYRMEGEVEAENKITLTRPYAIALTILSAAILLVGVIFGPWFNLASAAAKGLF